MPIIIGFIEMKFIIPTIIVNAKMKLTIRVIIGSSITGIYNAYYIRQYYDKSIVPIKIGIIRLQLLIPDFIRIFK